MWLGAQVCPRIWTQATDSCLQGPTRRNQNWKFLLAITLASQTLHSHMKTNALSLIYYVPLTKPIILPIKSDLCIYTPVCIHGCVHLHVSAFLCICKCVCMNVQVYVQISACACMPVCTCVYIRVVVWTHACMYIGVCLSCCTCIDFCVCTACG